MPKPSRPFRMRKNPYGRGYKAHPVSVSGPEVSSNVAPIPYANKYDSVEQPKKKDWHVVLQFENPGDREDIIEYHDVKARTDIEAIEIAKSLSKISYEPAHSHAYDAVINPEEDFRDARQIQADANAALQVQLASGRDEFEFAQLETQVDEAPVQLPDLTDDQAVSFVQEAVTEAQINRMLIDELDTSEAFFRSQSPYDEFYTHDNLIDITNDMYEKANYPTEVEMNSAIETYGISGAQQQFKPQTTEEWKARLGLVFLEPIIGGAQEAIFPFGGEFGTGRPATAPLRIAGAVLTPTYMDIAVGWALAKTGVSKAGRKLFAKIDDWLSEKSIRLGYSSIEWDEFIQLNKLDVTPDELNLLAKMNEEGITLEKLKELNAKYPDIFKTLEEVSEHYAKNPAQYAAGAAYIPQEQFILEQIAFELNMDPQGVIDAVLYNPDLFADGALLSALITSMSNEDAIIVLEGTTTIPQELIDDTIERLRSESELRDIPIPFTDFELEDEFDDTVPVIAPPDVIPDVIPDIVPPFEETIFDTPPIEETIPEEDTIQEPEPPFPILDTPVPTDITPIQERPTPERPRIRRRRVQRKPVQRQVRTDDPTRYATTIVYSATRNDLETIKSDANSFTDALGKAGRTRIRTEVPVETVTDLIRFEPYRFSAQMAGEIEPVGGVYATSHLEAIKEANMSRKRADIPIRIKTRLIGLNQYDVEFIYGDVR